jgi:hypothetical protein
MGVLIFLLPGMPVAILHIYSISLPQQIQTLTHWMVMACRVCIQVAEDPPLIASWILLSTRSCQSGYSQTENDRLQCG